MDEPRHNAAIVKSKGKSSDPFPLRSGPDYIAVEILTQKKSG